MPTKVRVIPFLALSSPLLTPPPFLFSDISAIVIVIAVISVIFFFFSFIHFGTRPHLTTKLFFGSRSLFFFSFASSRFHAW